VWRAYDYIFDFNPLATRLAEALFEAGDNPANFPHRGRSVHGTTIHEPVFVSPYIIRYRITGSDVVILRVRHSARCATNPGRPSL